MYADVQVELRHGVSGDRVFLIPSGAAPPRLRDTAFLRTPAGEAVVARKKEATEAFVDGCKNKELTGQKFMMNTRTGEERTKVYCADYDTFLKKVFGSE